MRSYFDATESKTPRTASALASSSTVRKPKWVSLMAEGASAQARSWSVPMPARAGGRRGGRRGRRRRVATRAGLGEPLLVLSPQVVLLRAEEVEIVPREDAGLVAVGKARQHGVVADRLERRHADVALARLQHFLPRAVALDLGRRRIDAHQLERDAKAAPVVEADLDDTRRLVDRDRGRTMRYS